MKKIYYTLFFFSLLSCVATAQEKEGDYKASKASKAIVIDGSANDSDWKKAAWKEVKYVWLGQNPTATDFKGKYKMLWDSKYLYFLVEVQDDSLSDQHKSPFDLWWEDDCLELFIDENNSDGDHQYNHSAFAYHITLDYDVVDMGTDQKPLLLNDHMKVKWVKTNKNTYVWEVAMSVYVDTFDPSVKTNKPVILTKGKKLGFAVSYNDNDGNNVRENMVSSVDVEGEDKNQGWKNAGVFGTLELVD